MFSDFLEIAQHLLDSGYKDPAASLAGAVFEDGLRRVCSAASVSFKKSDGLDALNTALAKAGAYNRLVQSKVDTWWHICNAADHGNFAEYGADDVRDMIAGVRDLLASHLT